MLLMVDVIRPGQPTEAEPVVIEAGDKTAWLVLDDGTEIAFDAQELRLALNPSEEARAA